MRARCSIASATRKRPCRWLLPSLAAAVLALAAAAIAQTGTDGAIGGRVLSAVGTSLPGALVVARAVDTGIAQRTRSGAHGDFLLPRLPVGDYVLTVEDSGVLLTMTTPIAVDLGEFTEVDARMAPAIASKPALPPTPSAQSTLNQQNLADLPLDGGNWAALALTAPGANAASEADDDAGDVSYRGTALTENSSRLDGISADQGFSGIHTGAGVEEESDTGADETYDPGPGSGSGTDGGRRAGSSYAFSHAAVREFRINAQGDAASYGSALYGHGVGGVITAVSRSGGARLHGMAFYTVRDSVWAAANPFAIASSYVNGVVTTALVKPADLRQQFGGSLGGPVPFRLASLLHARALPAPRRATSALFYFYAFDQQRRSFPAISSPAYAGFYSLTPTQTALLGNRGVSASKTMAALNYLDSLTGTIPRRADQTVNFARVDYAHNTTRLVLEYNRARWSSPAGARSGAVIDRGLASLGSSFGNVDSGVGRWVQFFSSRLSNELRLQYGHQLQYEATQPPLPQEPNIGPGGLAPEVSIGPQGFVFGTPAALGQRAYPDERRFEAANVLALVAGRHFIQLGGDFSAIRDFTNSLANAEGTFSYDSGATKGKAGGLVDWITDYTFNVNAYPNGGCPSIVAAIHDFCFRSYSQSFGQQSLTFQTQEWAAFFQDDWRVTPRLTLHAGLRYEYEFLPLPQQPNAGLDRVFGATGATSVYPEDRNNLGPRLGAVWQPFGPGRGTIHLGYGLYFGKLPGATIRAALLDTATASSTTRIRILPRTETACPQRTTVGFGYPCSFLATPPGVVAATTSAVLFDRRFRLPAVQQGTLAVEHELGWGILSSARYAFNLDRQLPNSVDINIAPSTGMRLFQLQGGTGTPGVQDGETFAVPLYSARVTPSFGPVTDIVSNSNATYHGLTVEARRGFGGGYGLGGIGRGFEFHLAYTWSKAIDFGQNAGAVPRTNGQFDPFTVAYDKGLSALNFPHRIVATVVWSPELAGSAFGIQPIERGLAAVASNWSIAAVFSQQSGRGYSYDIFGGTRLPGGHESINGSGGSVVLPTVGRNTLCLPDSTNLDLRLSRTFRFATEGLRLRASAEAFNLANHLNYSGVQQRAFLVGTPVAGVYPLIFQDAAAIAAEGLKVQPFGTHTAAGTSQARERQIQLGLRIEF